MDIRSFKEVAKQYKVIFFDSYGVLRNYKGILPGVNDMFQYLEDEGIDFYVLTNDASRSPELLAEKFQKNGIPKITVDKIISSGMIAREYLQNKVPQGSKVVYFGTDNSAHYIQSAGLQTISIMDVDIEEHDDIAALVMLDDEGYDWNTCLSKAVNLLRKKSMPVVVANTDGTYPVSKHDVAIAVGALADLLEPLARKTFIRFGKPDSQMFNFAYNFAVNDDSVGKKDILMVGDTLKTDIIGGNKFGIDTCLVLSGNIQSKNAELIIASTGIVPDFICDSVTT